MEAMHEVRLPAENAQHKQAFLRHSGRSTVNGTGRGTQETAVTRRRKFECASRRADSDVLKFRARRSPQTASPIPSFRPTAP